MTAKLSKKAVENIVNGGFIGRACENSRRIFKNLIESIQKNELYGELVGGKNALNIEEKRIVKYHDVGTKIKPT